MTRANRIPRLPGQALVQTRQPLLQRVLASLRLAHQRWALRRLEVEAKQLRGHMELDAQCLMALELQGQSCPAMELRHEEEGMLLHSLDTQIRVARQRLGLPT